MDVDQLLQSKRLEIMQIASKHGASNVRVSGSVMRGDARPDSDIDFLINLEDKRS
jgi:predicted nucleotidyltransferase